jgi:hypothetical protein
VSRRAAKFIAAPIARNSAAQWRFGIARELGDVRLARRADAQILPRPFCSAIARERPPAVVALRIMPLFAPQHLLNVLPKKRTFCGRS